MAAPASSAATPAAGQGGAGAPGTGKGDGSGALPPAGTPEAEACLVLVSGVSGFVAANVAYSLLRRGYRVRGTVRDLGREDKVAPLRTLCPGAKHELELVQADLTDPVSWRKAVADGVTHVMHVASPFPDAKPDDENVLIRPAVDGTLNVLRACADTNGGVRRVVVTSSIAAVAGHDDGTEEDSDDESSRAKEYDESMWTDLTRAPAYPKSKTMAERAAWRFVEELPGPQQFELATVNPGFVIGPMLTKSPCTSAKVPTALLLREYPALPDLSWPAVDVRDVARMHVLAQTTPEAAGHRFLAVESTMILRELGDPLAAVFDPLGYDVPTMPLPKWMLWVASTWDKSAEMVLGGVGKRVRCSNAKAKRILGMEFRPMDRAMIDMCFSLVRNGLVEDKSGGRITRGEVGASTFDGDEPAAAAAAAAAGAGAASGEASAGADGTDGAAGASAATTAAAPAESAVESGDASEEAAPAAGGGAEDAAKADA